MPGFSACPFDDRGAGTRSRDETVGDHSRADPGRGRRGRAACGLPEAVARLCDRGGCCSFSTKCRPGWGAPGKLFAYQQPGVKPDIMTLAKALGGGMPIGAMIARGEIAASFTPGSHGSTFGGNPVACAAALAVLDALEKDDVMENASASAAIC